jgi:hypothetical protein
VNALFALALLSAPAAPDADATWPCHPGAAQTGPVEVSYESGSLGAPRRACPRTEFHLGARGQAIADTANFYGNIQASVPVGLSVAVDERLELHVNMELFHYRNIIQSIAASHAGLGHTQLGATVVILHENQLVLSAVTRTTLPTALGLYNNAPPFGLDAGFSFAFGLADHVLLHGSLLGTGSITQSPAPLASLGYSGALSAEYMPNEWLSLVMTGASLALFQADLDHASLAGAARVRLWRGLSAELFVAVPIGGAERNLGQGGLNLRWRAE